MSTFAELGAPFPLFEAPVEDATEFIGASRCSLCDREAAVCFELGIGCAVMRECPTCGTLNGLDASDAESIDCRACQQLVVFPDLPEQIVACYSCLRQGRAALTKDTELGMVSWEQAFEGVTHGIPGLARSDFELVPKESDWVGARLPDTTMFELLRTPTYLTIQGEQWLFCCKAPMVFVGSWSRDRFTKEAPDGDGRAYFESIVADPVPGLWEDQLHDATGIYVFRCPACRRLKAHWDLA
jgi:uncharacterized protein CbrC (UPF0167 family)